MPFVFNAISITKKKKIFCPLELSLRSMHVLLLLLGSCRQKASHDLEKEVKNLRLEFSDLHLKHKSLARELWRHQDIDAKSKAGIKRLKGNFLICFFFL